METTVVKTSDVTIYIHDDDCNSDMDEVIQEVAGIIIDAYKRNAEENPNNHQVYKDEPPQ